MRAALATLLVVAAAGQGLAADSYDKTWYASDFWTGEYPDGFTVTAATTLKIRSEASQTAPATLECTLAQGATYHPWNAARVERDKLEFKSFNKIDALTVNDAMDVILYAREDGSEVPTHFAKGDRWRYLTYLAEGQFLMETRGKFYEGDQDLLENSTSTDPDISGNDEWMKLTCANGTIGWLLFADVQGTPGIGEPNIVTYGEAADAAN